MSSRGPRRTATAFGALVMACAPATLLIHGLSGRSLSGLAYSSDGVGVVMALTYGAAGLWVARRRPGNPLGWLLLVLGGASGVAGVAASYAHLGLVDAPGSLPGAVAAAWLGSWVWLISLHGLLTLLLPLAPSGSADTRARRLLVAAGCLSPLLVGLGLGLSADALHDLVPGLTNPVAVPGAALVLLLTGGALTAVVAVVALVDAVRRLLRAVSPEREQLAWLLITVVAAFLGSAVSLPWRLPLLALVPFAVAVGLVRHQLLDLQVVVRRTLLYSALTGAIVVMVAGTTFLASSVLPQGPLPLAIAAALVAVALEPARSRLQAAVDRFVFGSRRDPVRALAQVGTRLTQHPEDVLLPELLEAMCTAVRAPGAHLLLDDGTVRTFGRPVDKHGALVQPLVAGGRQVGELSLGARGPRDGWSTADRRLVETLSPQVALVVRAVALAEQVARSRDAALTATAAERSRVRAELHDGLGVALAGLALGLEAASAAAQDGPPLVTSLLTRLHAETRLTATELRRLVEGLAPQALLEHGLVQALQEQVSAVTRDCLAVQLRVLGPVCELPPEVAFAAYRVACEALTNVVRHAGAYRCRVELAAHDGSLLLTVEDDGRGLPLIPTQGVGLPSMRRRVEGLGGEFSVIEGAGGGVRLAASWPLRATVPSA